MQADKLPPPPLAERNSWPHGWHGLYTAEQMHAYAAAAIAEASEGLRADAMRYRHLRNWGEPALCIAVNGSPSYIGDAPNDPAGARLDAAIDAAMER